MTNYREILRLYSPGISQRGIASSCERSRNTISAVLKRTDEIGISWPFLYGCVHSLATYVKKKEFFQERVI